MDELDEEICELYGKRRRQQMEREAELQHECQQIETDCRVVSEIIQQEIQVLRGVLKHEKELAMMVHEEGGDGAAVVNLGEDGGIMQSSVDVEKDAETIQKNELATAGDENNQKNELKTTGSSTDHTTTDNTTSSTTESSSTTTTTDNTTSSTSISPETTSTNTTTTTEMTKKTNRQIIEEMIRAIIETKKKVSLFSSEIINNDLLVDRLSQCNHCFMTTYSDYVRYKDLLSEIPDAKTLSGTSSKGRLRSCSATAFSPELLGTSRESLAITTEFQRKKIVSILPNRFHLSNWSLLYSTLEHGISIKTLYRRAQDVESSILVIKTMDNQGRLFCACCLIY